MVVLDAGRLGDRSYLPLATKNGRIIPNEMRLERNPVALKASIDIFSQSCPMAILRSITATYNCMGMVFASRRTTISINELGMIMEDDGYIKVSGVDNLMVGDMAVYYRDRNNATHVGVIVGIDYDRNLKRKITVMSKWGADGEYIHPIDHVPEAYGKGIEYWTDRKGI